MTNGFGYGRLWWIRGRFRFSLEVFLLRQSQRYLMTIALALAYVFLAATITAMKIAFNQQSTCFINLYRNVEKLFLHTRFF